MNIVKLIRNFQKDGFVTNLRSMYYRRIKSKRIIPHKKAIIKGVTNIDTFGELKVGVGYVGFVHEKDITYLNINGKLAVEGDFLIGRGCRIDVGRSGTIVLGGGSYFNAFCTIIIMHSLHIGKSCAIAWNCKFLDEDFHELSYDGKKEIEEKGIYIGDDVWIGANVSIYKGVRIPDNCVVAADSVVKNSFCEENVLIAGNPAKIVKRNITHHL